MLETLMKFGGYRIDRFPLAVHTGKEFGFYLRPQVKPSSDFYGETKYQLYYGLAMIYNSREIDSLAGVYIDIAELENLQRPAYLALKQDLHAGSFSKVMIVEREALLGDLTAEADLFRFSQDVAGLELFRFQAGKREVFPLFAEIIFEFFG